MTYFAEERRGYNPSPHIGEQCNCRCNQCGHSELRSRRSTVSRWRTYLPYLRRKTGNSRSA
jgi:hypothetical protein